MSHGTTRPTAAAVRTDGSRIAVRTGRGVAG